MINLYRTPHYAHCFAEDFTICEITCAQSWALQRPIEHTEYYDLTGLYPLWYGESVAKAQMAESLGAQNAISFVGVVLEENQPRDWDYLAPFKTHYITDLQKPITFSQHHQYEARRARKQHVEARIVLLKDHIDSWIHMYASLVTRHNIHGLTVFSCAYFQRLAMCPEVLAFAAFQDEQLLAMHLFAITDENLTSHLATSTDTGYRLGAMYAINAAVLAWAQASGFRAVNWGGCAGSVDQFDGLAKFKQGFSNTTRQSYVAGVVGMPEIYAQLCAGNPTLNQPSFFPGYRR